jgi:hypothetical protein
MIVSLLVYGGPVPVLCSGDSVSRYWYVSLCPGRREPRLNLLKYGFGEGVLWRVPN